MTLKPAVWFRIAVVLSVINVAAAGFALGGRELGHAAVHVVLAMAFGMWARSLRRSPRESEPLARTEALEALEADMNNLRQELSETQERLDFAERMLAQRPETRRVDPQR